MAKCNQLTPLPFKGLNSAMYNVIVTERFSLSSDVNFSFVNSIVN